MFQIQCFEEETFFFFIILIGLLSSGYRIWLYNSVYYYVSRYHITVIVIAVHWGVCYKRE